MKQLLVLFFCGLPIAVSAQSSATPARGTNPNADAPVNMPVPSLRPAEPTMHSSVPVQNPGQFYVKDDKPVTSAGQPVAAPDPATDKLPKEEWHKKKAEAAKANNTPVTTQKAALEQFRAGQEGAKKPAPEGNNNKSGNVSNSSSAAPAGAR